jgi:hypothetical protein
LTVNPNPYVREIYLSRTVDKEEAVTAACARLSTATPEEISEAVGTPKGGAELEAARIR